MTRKSKFEKFHFKNRKIEIRVDVTPFEIPTILLACT